MVRQFLVRSLSAAVMAGMLQSAAMAQDENPTTPGVRGPRMDATLSERRP